MQTFAFSSTSVSSWIFRVLCLVCCLVIVASYNIDHRPLAKNRPARAVTEWRFRRNYFLRFPHVFRVHDKDDQLIDNDAVENVSNYDGKRFIIPQLAYEQ